MFSTSIFVVYSILCWKNFFTNEDYENPIVRTRVTKKKKKILYLDAMKTKVSDRRKTVNQQQVSWRHDAFA